MLKKSLLLLASASLLSACSFFSSPQTGRTEQGDEDAIFDTRLGVNVEQLTERLPKTLQGDKQNARYSDEDLKGKDGNGGNS